MNLLKYPALKLIALVVLLCTLQTAKGQSQSGINNLITKIDTFSRRMPTEKLYLQFDKPYYAVGDTIWFKAYLLNSTLNYSRLSSRLYVEVLNDSSKVLKRMVFPMGVGITWGDIELDGIHEGSVNIRAYTNWMRNFGEDYFFNRAFYIANPQRQTWLVNASSQLTGNAANNVKMSMQFTSTDSQSPGLKQMQLKVLDGKKVLFKGTGETTAEGNLDVNFPLPEKTQVKNLVLIAQDKTDAKRQAIIPVSTHRAKDIDVQFMPEGGYMIAGLPAHVGFKAIGDDGHGVDISGKIVNAAGEEVITFESLHKGIGIFDLAPQAGDVYTAKIMLPGGQTKDVPLPAIKTSGTEIRVRNIAERDSMDVSVFMTPDLIKPGGSYYLVGQSRNIVCFGASVPTSRAFATVHVAKSLFPTGIVHFTLLNSAEQPLNERLTFVDHHDNLKVSIAPSQKVYAPHDSIPVKITVNDQSGKPVVGSFSLAVTDDNQVRTDSIGAGNILTRFLLSSDLKGYVDEPSYYFKGDKNAWMALDALLLTQGWVGYNWPSIINPVKPVYQPEYQFTVSGKVTNLFNKPIPKAEVVLLATGKYHYVKDTVTDASGRFVFQRFQPIDSTKFVLQAQNAKHKVIKAGITIDEQNAPAVDKANILHAVPWYVNSDSKVLNYVRTNPKYHSEMEKAQYGPAGRLLRTVTIRNNRLIKGSANLNDDGEADQTIDEETIENANKTSLYDLLLQKVQGYYVGYLNPPSNARAGVRNMSVNRKPPQMAYMIKDKRVHFVFDGVDINRFYQPTQDEDGNASGMNDEYYQYVKGYLDYFTAEDIRGIEVLYSSNNVARYNMRNLENDEIINLNPAGRVGSGVAFIEITTRAGAGPFSQRATGVYVYKPLTITLPKTFYRPRYAVKGAGGKYADLRSTIHWEPAVVTNKSGEATLSFYAADKPSTYTLILEGGDLNGKLGYSTQKITISGK